MEDLEVRCPYCGEPNAIQVEWGVHGTMIHDCWVCCHPMQLDVAWDEWGDPVVTAGRDDD